MSHSGGEGRSPFVEIPVAVLDVLESGPVPRPNTAGQLSVLVVARGTPIGNVLLDDVPRAPGYPDLRDACLRRLRSSGTPQALDPSTGPADLLSAIDVAYPARALRSTAAISVVVCTLGQNPHLARTVRELLEQSHANLELCVVDNRPSSGGTRAALAGITDPRLRIIEEPRPGLAVARNTGLAQARHPLVAFTDDDALPDRHWLASVVDVFEADPDKQVSGVTGLIRAAELATPEQVWFEAYGGLDCGYEPRVWFHGSPPASLARFGTPASHGPFFPYAAGKVGAGANMAFRTAHLRALGGFDVALGAGSVTKGGEDLAVFSDVLVAGGAIVYTPRALVWHYHRQTYEDLRTQMRGYGCGMGSLITKQCLRGPRQIGFFARKAPRALLYLLAPTSSRNTPRAQTFPRALAAEELRGLASAPYCLLRSRYSARRRGLHHPAPMGTE